MGWEGKGCKSNALLGLNLRVNLGKTPSHPRFLYKVSDKWKHTMTLQLLEWPSVMSKRICLWVFLPNIFLCVTPSHPPTHHSLEFWSDSNGLKIREAGFGPWFQLWSVDSLGWLNQLSLRWYVFLVSRVVGNFQHRSTSDQPILSMLGIGFGL